MNERRLRELLLTAPVPEELEAQRRSWAVVRSAFEEREPVRRPRRRARPLLALACGIAIAAAALTPPGQAVLGSLRDAIGRERVVGLRPAKPALISLPAPGRLLVTSSKGPWIVHADGSKRRLGAYEDASWSPRGLFVVATRGRQLVALDPTGAVRWSLARPAPVARPRWSPSGFRIAYLSGRSLRVVAGDGTGDRLLARVVAAVAPAWRPGQEHVLAFADRRGRVHLVAVDSGRVLWRTAAGEALTHLSWSSDGERLLALAGRSLRIFDGAGRLLETVSMPGARAVTASFAPKGHSFALIRRALGTGRSEVLLLRADGRRAKERRLFAGAGEFADVAWSPDGRWLLLGWRGADQWLFLRSAAVERVVAVSNVSRQFDPGGRGPASFPRVAGWCCPQQ